MPRKINDLTHQQFGKWTVLERAENDKNKIPRWRCKCKCGAIHVVLSHKLYQGGSRQCKKCAYIANSQKLRKYHVGDNNKKWQIVTFAEKKQYAELVCLNCCHILTRRVTTYLSDHPPKCPVCKH